LKNTKERSKEIAAELSSPDGIAKRWLGDTVVELPNQCKRGQKRKFWMVCLILAVLNGF
jgi:hypothetical protein